MSTTEKSVLVIFLMLALLGCNLNDPITPDENEVTSIVGQIVDKASGNAITSAYVKIAQEGSTYGTTTDGSGHFSFQNIESGTYKLVSEVNSNGTTLTDTVGYFSTDSTDWGMIYNEIFVSISGRITIEGEVDHSFIQVQLLGTGNSALTDNGGRFRFDFILPGQYDLFATNDDDDFLDYRENNIILEAGDIFYLDTTLTYLFRSLDLVTIPELYPKTSWAGGGGFAFYDGTFYYGSGEGLIAFDSQSEQDVLIYQHQFLGSPKISSDYDGGFWFAMDTPEYWIYRRYSLAEQTVTDSIAHAQFSTTNFNLAWDPVTQRLFGTEWSSGGPGLSIYDPSLGSVEYFRFPFEYDPETYTALQIAGIFIDPQGKLYLTTRFQNAQGWQTHLYICEDTIDYELNKIYRIAQDIYGGEKICWYEGRLIMVPYSGSQEFFYEIVL